MSLVADSENYTKIISSEWPQVQTQISIIFSDTKTYVALALIFVCFRYASFKTERLEDMKNEFKRCPSASAENHTEIESPELSLMQITSAPKQIALSRHPLNIEIGIMPSMKTYVASALHTALGLKKFEYILTCSCTASCKFEWLQDIRNECKHSLRVGAKLEIFKLILMSIFALNAPGKAPQHLGKASSRGGESNLITSLIFAAVCSMSGDGNRPRKLLRRPVSIRSNVNSLGATTWILFAIILTMNRWLASMGATLTPSSRDELKSAIDSCLTESPSGDCTDYASTNGIGTIKAWDTSKVTNMHKMLYTAKSFNADINAWDTSKVTNMHAMFDKAKSFDANISNWDTSAVETMHDTFLEATSFNADIKAWDTSRVTNMQAVLHTAESFNADIKAWDTSKVTNMHAMFYQAKLFNADITAWNTSSVTTMNHMLHTAKSFNADIKAWDTKKSRISDGYCQICSSVYCNGTASICNILLKGCMLYRYALLNARHFEDYFRNSAKQHWFCVASVKQNKTFCWGLCVGIFAPRITLCQPNFYERIYICTSKLNLVHFFGLACADA